MRVLLKFTPRRRSRRITSSASCTSAFRSLPAPPKERLRQRSNLSPIAESAPPLPYGFVPRIPEIPTIASPRKPTHNIPVSVRLFMRTVILPIAALTARRKKEGKQVIRDPGRLFSPALYFSFQQNQRSGDKQKFPACILFWKRDVFHQWKCEPAAIARSIPAPPLPELDRHPCHLHPRQHAVSALPPTHTAAPALARTISRIARPAVPRKKYPGSFGRDCSAE